MSRRHILRGTIGFVIVVCGLLFSLSHAVTTHAATRVSVAPQLCGGSISWDYVTSDTKYQTYTYIYHRVGQVQLTLQVHVMLEAEFDDSGYCGDMRSELTISEVSCSSSDSLACNVYGTAQAYFVLPSGQHIYASTSGNAGASDEIDIATNGMRATAGAAGGTWEVSGYPKVTVGTAQEPY